MMPWGCCFLHSMVPCGTRECTHLLSVQGQQRWEEAIATCQEGMALPSATRDFHPLRDAIAVQAALAGCFAGFQGRWLDVSLHPPVSGIACSDRGWYGKFACSYSTYT